VGHEEVVGRSGGLLNGGDPKGGGACLQVEIPMASTSTNTLDPSMGEECLQVDLDMAIGADAGSQDLKVTRIMSEAVATT
jgi:hypothetical protein